MMSSMKRLIIEFLPYRKLNKPGRGYMVYHYPNRDKYEIISVIFNDLRYQ